MAHEATVNEEIAHAYGTGRSPPPRGAPAAGGPRFGGAFTADDLVARLRDDTPASSTATAYRAIAAMVASGFLTPVGERDGAALYAHCAETGHHHHVVCTGCGATAHAPCPLDQAGLAASAPEGFVVTAHDVRLYGLCAACSEAAESADGCSCDASESPAGGE
jgi:Fur family ferric uptake transcriptional regulator